MNFLQKTLVLINSPDRFLFPLLSIIIFQRKCRQLFSSLRRFSETQRSFDRKFKRSYESMGLEKQPGYSRHNLYALCAVEGDWFFAKRNRLTIVNYKCQAVGRMKFFLDRSYQFSASPHPETHRSRRRGRRRFNRLGFEAQHLSSVSIKRSFRFRKRDNVPRR